jgi:hypothetical protein
MKPSLSSSQLSSSSLSSSLRFSLSMRLLSVAIFLLSVLQMGFAQGAATGDLRVIVSDTKGNFVTNANVIVRDEAKGLERAGSSDGQGGYSVRQLAPGNYNVTVDAPGFGKTEATAVAINVGGMAELPVSLSVAGSREVVEVNSQAEIVETSRSSTTDTIGQRRIDNLPINGRNYINFTLTDSQVVRDNAPNTGAAPTSGLNINRQLREWRPLDGFAGGGSGISDHHEQLRRRIWPGFRWSREHHYPVRLE